MCHWNAPQEISCSREPSSYPPTTESREPSSYPPTTESRESVGPISDSFLRDYFFSQRFSLHAFFNMDTQINPRRALKSAQVQEDRRRRRNERDRARHVAETAEQRSERLRKRRERDHARHAAQTASERQATSQRQSTRECERTAAETPEERETRLQRMSTNQCERLAGEAPEERETRLQQMRDRLAAGQELPSPQDVDPYDAHLARTFVPNTAQRLTEQETIRQSINERRSHQPPPTVPWPPNQWDTIQ